MRTVTQQIILSLLMFLPFNVEGDAKSDKQKELYRRLTRRSSGGYDSPPPGKTIVNLNSISIEDFYVNEDSHAVNLDFAMSMDWVDSRLKWNKSDYANIETISISSYYYIWRPDKQNDNAKYTYDKKQWAYEPLTVSYNGAVKYVPLYSPTFRCIMDMTYWPHDKQNCSMTLRSWRHGEDTLDYNIKDPIDANIYSRTSNSEAAISDQSWIISGVKMVKGSEKYDCCLEKVVVLTTYISFERNAPALNWSVKIPVLGLSVLSILIFLMPPGSSMKFVYGGICMFILTSLLRDMDYFISHTTNHTPLLVQFVGQQAILLVLYMILTALVVRTSTSPHAAGLPPVLKGPVLMISRFILLGNYADQACGSSKNFAWALHNEQEELSEDSPVISRLREKSEWRLLGAVVDRLALLLSIAIWLISLARYGAVI